MSDNEFLKDYNLPSFETWGRYLRKARRLLGEQKNTPRAGRLRGRSIVGEEDI